MLKPISRLRSICNGDLNIIVNPHLLLLSIRQKQHVGRNILHSIPVLSIFVLLGIIGFSTIGLPLAESDGEVYAETLNTNTSLIIDNGTATDSTATVRGGVAYSSHTVQVSASNITGYTLSITGPTNLSNGSTTISGAGGKQGSAMLDNTWGYAWVDNNTTPTNDNLTYNSFNNNNAITLATANSVSGNSVNLDKKLVFAAKFSQDAIAGHYRANVALNLTVTPKTVTTYNYSVTYDLNGGTGTAPLAQANSDSSSYTFYAPSGDNIKKSGYRFLGWSTSSTATSPTYVPGAAISLISTGNTKNLYAVWKLLSLIDITTMQEMTAAICKTSKVGDSNILEDSRDTNSYTVQKLADGNCWMVDNLMLDLSVKGIATSSASDNLSSDYPKTPLTNRFSASDSGSNSWVGDGTLAEFSKAPQIASGMYPGDGNRYQPVYGSYYSWCAATADTCSGATSNKTDAAGSICPKGWKLPKGGTTVAINTATSQTGNDFVNLANVNGANLAAIGTSTSMTWTDYVSSTIPKSITLGNAAWYMAGYVDEYALSYPGNQAFYWSRTSYETDRAYDLAFNGRTLYPVLVNGFKRTGYSVRCVAYSS